MPRVQKKATKNQRREKTREAQRKIQQAIALDGGTLSTYFKAFGSWRAC